MTHRAQGDVEALGRQALALGEFSESGREAMAQADRAAGEVIDRVNTELARRRAAFARAEDALRACLRAEQGSCDAEARAVTVAQQDVEAAQGALRIANQADSQFQAPKARYARECARLVGEGKRRLSAMSTDLETYLQRVSAAAAAGTGDAAHNGSISMTASSDGLPEGCSIVPLGAIDDSDSGVSGTGSFDTGYNPEDLAWAFGALHEVVLPAMARGKGPDYFQQRDHAEGRTGVRSYGNTYRGFFGEDSAIKLDPLGDGTYTVANGYHRIWVAKQMGLSSVPGRIK